jgi:hypothetical protein
MSFSGKVKGIFSEKSKNFISKNTYDIKRDME